MKEFEGNFECLGENTEKYITFSIPIKKKIANKDIEITYKIKLIDSFRFLTTSLSKLVDNLTEDIHGDKCVDCKSDLSYMKVIDEALIFRCFNRKKNYRKEINKELIERFASTYKFCNNDLNKFAMLLRKGVYFDSFVVEHIRKEIMKFIARKKKTNIYRIQAYDSIMCGYFCIGFINFMFNGKSLTDYTDLFSPNDLKKTMT